jgi:hypothetical protein
MKKEKKEEEEEDGVWNGVGTVLEWIAPRS